MGEAGARPDEGKGTEQSLEQDMEKVMKSFLKFIEDSVSAIKRTGPAFWCMGVGTALLALLITIIVSVRFGLFQEVSRTALVPLAAAGSVVLIAGVTLCELGRKWQREAELKRIHLAPPAIERIAKARKTISGTQFTEPPTDISQ